MNKTIKIELSADSIDKAIKEIEEYKDDLNRRIKKFVQILADKGVSVAESANSVSDNGVNYLDLIEFSTEVTSSNGTTTGIVWAVEKQKIIRSWRYRGGDETAEVSPLMMAEFGSGVYAEERTMESGNVAGGRGTFPGQKHAFDESGWYWVDSGTNKAKFSKGISPSEPMYRASLNMKDTVSEAVQEAFGSM